MTLHQLKIGRLITCIQPNTIGYYEEFKWGSVQKVTMSVAEFIKRTLHKAYVVYSETSTRYSPFVIDTFSNRICLFYVKNSMGVSIYDKENDTKPLFSRMMTENELVKIGKKK